MPLSQQGFAFFYHCSHFGKYVMNLWKVTPLYVAHVQQCHCEILVLFCFLFTINLLLLPQNKCAPSVFGS